MVRQPYFYAAEETGAVERPPRRYGRRGYGSVGRCGAQAVMQVLAASSRH